MTTKTLSHNHSGTSLPKRESFNPIRYILVVLLLAFIAAAAFFANKNLVYAGITENVTIPSGGIELSGIFVRPDTPGPHPVIIMLHGSGTNQVHSKWHFRIHGNEFLRHGFAVLAYDKRGQGQSGGDHPTATFEDWVSDSLAAIDYLRSRPDVDPDRIGLFGVSESGWYAPEIAAKDGNIAFIINRVSTPLTWKDTVLWEVEAEARSMELSEAEIAMVLDLKSREWQYYIDTALDPSLVDGPERDAINAELAGAQDKSGIKAFFAPELRPYDPETYAYLGQKYGYDPMPFLREIDVPMLYVLAGRDVNIPYQATVSGLRELVDLGKPIEIETFPEANHYLYRWERLPLEGLYQEGYLDLLGDWAGGH